VVRKEFVKAIIIVRKLFVTKLVWKPFVKPFVQYTYLACWCHLHHYCCSCQCQCCNIGIQRLCAGLVFHDWVQFVKIGAQFSKVSFNSFYVGPPTHQPLSCAILPIIGTLVL
jgi:hypothetical protein